MSEGPKKTTSADALEFVKENVLSISDLTRTKKLAHILDSYAGNTNDQIYIVQNSKNRKAQAVLSDLDYFLDLLNYREAIEDAVDQLSYELALERKDDQADIPLDQVISDYNLDVDHIMELADALEEE
jgi:F0F1-type ATP synthase delta subunit